MAACLPSKAIMPHPATTALQIINLSLVGETVFLNRGGTLPLLRCIKVELKYFISNIDNLTLQFVNYDL